MKKTKSKSTQAKPALPWSRVPESPKMSNENPLPEVPAFSKASSPEFVEALKALAQTKSGETVTLDLKLTCPAWVAVMLTAYASRKQCSIEDAILELVNSPTLVDIATNGDVKSY